jgi:diguanylate cyclase (GGDEF)-like protein/PAS domain S-box-containing protein
VLTGAESRIAVNNLVDSALSWHRLLDVLPDGVALVDESGVIRHVNEFLTTMTGYTHGEIVGQTVEMLVPQRHQEAHVRRRGEFAKQSGTRQMGVGADLNLICRDGSELAIDVALAAIDLDGQQWVVVAIRDDSFRREASLAQDLAQSNIAATKLAAAETIAASDRRFRNSFEHNMSPMIFTDLDDRIIAVNDAFCDVLGRTKEELLGRDSKSFTHREDLGITEESRRRATDGEKGQLRYTKRFLHKDGRTIVVEVSRSSARDDEGTLQYHVVSVRDVTDRVKRDHLLGLLTPVVHLAMGATDEAQFLQQLCEVLVDQGGYELAWIAITFNGDEGDVEVLCAAGATGYLDAIAKSGLQSTPMRQGPSRSALRTGVSQVVNDLAHHAMFTPWAESATRWGFGSMAAVPDRLGDNRAALLIYHRDVYEFDNVTVKGLEAVVREAEFAVAHVRSIKQTESALEETTAAVEALRGSERALTESEERFRLAFENNMAPMVFSDLDDLAIAVNDAFCAMVGFTREELLGKDSLQFTYPGDVGITERSHVQLASNEVDQVRYVKRYLRKDGRVIVSEVSRSAARDLAGRTLYFVASERDVTEERALTAELSHKVLHDSLTGLANRTLFEDRLSQAHERAARHGGMCAVLMLDLDDFRGVNETHGHLVGDELLVAIARRFEQVTRSSDTLCRFGGDEFLYLAEGLASGGEADEVAARLLGALNEPFLLAGTLIKQGASVGVVLWDGASERHDEFVQDADVALYETKRHRRGNFTRFDPAMHQLAASRFELIQELRHALAAGEIAMHYQPIVDLTTTGVVGFEALMRWQHPERGPVPPLVFIPLAEQSDLILELGSFAMREAVAAASTWGSRDAQEALPYVTVNLSARQFHDPGLVAITERVLRSSGLAPERLIIEITESVTQIDVDETMDVIKQLKALGVSFALDDFGTGYSSLSYLALLSPQIIKIDKSFVNPATESEQHETLLETIILLGDKLGRVMLAEGIETKENLDHVRRLGCALGQGYLFSPAVPGADAARMVGRFFGDDVEMAADDYVI